MASENLILDREYTQCGVIVKVFRKNRTKEEEEKANIDLVRKLIRIIEK